MEEYSAQPLNSDLEQEPFQHNQKNPWKIASIFLLCILVCITAYFLMVPQLNNYQDKEFVAPIKIMPSPTAIISPVLEEPVEKIEEEESEISEQDNWKKYENEEYGFSFMYPPDWIIFSKESKSFIEERDLVGISIKGEKQKSGTELYDGAALTFGLPMQITENTESWFNDYYTKENGFNAVGYSSQEVINDLVFYKYYSCGLGCFTFYNTLNDGEVFRIRASSDGPDSIKYSAQIQKILESLEFVE